MKLVEPIVPEFFVSGLDRIELMGGNARYVMFSEQPTQEGGVIRVPRLHIIMPNSALPDTIRQFLLVPVPRGIQELISMQIN